MKFCVYKRPDSGSLNNDNIGIVANNRVYPIHQFFTQDQVNESIHGSQRMNDPRITLEQKQRLQQSKSYLISQGLPEYWLFYAHFDLFMFVQYAWNNKLLPDNETIQAAYSYLLSDVELLPFTISFSSFRDFYAFEQHVRTARAHRGLEVPPEWYKQPVFYFSNHRAIWGNAPQLHAPRHGQWLDYELEVAAIIGTPCQDVPASEAESVIAGYTILNDWSLRDLQRQEMPCGLGPAKGKDFATSLGPYLVTPDELADRLSGKGYDLAMVAHVNGVELSRGNWKDIHFSFAEMIERASRGVTLYPGDVLGSGTVGTGCILELTPEAVAARLGRESGWLLPGDIVELEVERLGILRTEIVES